VRSGHQAIHSVQVVPVFPSPVVFSCHFICEKNGVVKGMWLSATPCSHELQLAEISAYFPANIAEPPATFPHPFNVIPAVSQSLGRSQEGQRRGTRAPLARPPGIIDHRAPFVAVIMQKTHSPQRSEPWFRRVERQRWAI
jgi:hypothetical protein